MRININFSTRAHEYATTVYLALAILIAAGAFAFYVNLRDYNNSLRMTAALEGELKLVEKARADTEKRLTAVKGRVALFEKESPAHEGDFANSVIKRRAFSWTLFMNRLERLVPDGVGITAIKPDFETLSIDITGTALSMEQVRSFIENIVKSPYFDDMPPLFQAAEVEVDKDIGKKIYTFSIKSAYYPNGKAGNPATEQAANAAASEKTGEDTDKPAPSVDAPAQTAVKTALPAGQSASSVKKPMPSVVKPTPPAVKTALPAGQSASSVKKPMPSVVKPTPPAVKGGK